MDYKRIYDELIEYRKQNIPSCYTENHHIKMKSLGGTDDKDNLVRLTAREHFIVHLLLAKFNRCSQTANALWMMQCKPTEDSNRIFIKSSRMYEWARREFAKYISRNNRITLKGERNSQHGTRWICNVNLKENKKISNVDELPSGWILGRNKWIVKIKKNTARVKLNQMILINNGITNTRLIWEDQLPIPDGWKEGVIFSKDHIKSISEARRKSNFKLKGSSGQGGRHKAGVAQR